MTCGPGPLGLHGSMAGVMTRPALVLRSRVRPGSSWSRSAPSRACAQMAAGMTALHCFLSVLVAAGVLARPAPAGRPPRAAARRERVRARRAKRAALIKYGSTRQRRTYALGHDDGR